MKSIIFIIPYFGKLPEYFDVWKMSALYNKTVDFLFFTDIDELQEEENIKVVHISFNDFVKNFQEKFNFEISLQRAYKLCDFRPTYGFVLHDFVKDYDFWGNCDIDLIFGDIRRFITDDLLEKYEKILEHGHFTLYKNDVKMNSIFMSGNGYGEYNYKNVLSSPESLYFDECLGMQQICRKQNIKTYYNQDIFFDVKPWEKPFKHINGNDQSTIFKYAGGKIYKLTMLSDDTIEEEEIMYAHFQKRRMDWGIVSGDYSQSFYIKPNKAFNTERLTRADFACKGINAYKLKKKIERLKEYIKRYKQGRYPSFNIYKNQRHQLGVDITNSKEEIKKRDKL